MSAALDIRAIRVLYEGVHFRSRLEARWARFFDALQEPWLYEPEGFELPSGRYVPDFLIPRADMWLEIKPYRPTPSERASCRDLCEATGKLVVCMHGAMGQWLDPKQAMWQPTSGLVWIPRQGPDGDVIADESERWWPCLCPHCERFGFAFEGDGGDVCRRAHVQCDGIGDGRFTFDHPNIEKAIRIANAQSFW